jgi:hypothetical protein
MEQTCNRSQCPREPWNKRGPNQRVPTPWWNKGKLVGQKAPFKLKEIWAIRVWLQLEHRTRVAPRAIVMQQKTSRPVQFEITEPCPSGKPA